MATYEPPKRATEYIFYVGLISQVNTKLLQVNPTLATGDVQISKDGGAFANLTTLPVVTPAGGRSVKVTLSLTEMTADNVAVFFSDAAGAEWCDLFVNIQTAARQIDDLAFPNVSGRGVDVDATGGVEITANQAVNVAQWNGSAVATPTVAGVPEVDITHVNGVAQTATLDTIKAETASIQTDTNDIQARLPAALVGGRIDASVGAMAAGTVTAAAIATDAIDADALATDGINEIADGLLNRNMTTGTDSGTETVRTVRQALRILRNKVDVPLGTVYKEDDATASWTFAKTTDAAAVPITVIDPVSV